MPWWWDVRRPLVWLLAGTTALGVAATLAVHTVTLVALFVVPATVAAQSLAPGPTAVVAAYASAWALYLSLRVHAFSGFGHGSGFASTVLVGLISIVAAYHRLAREATLRKISLVAEAAQATIVRPIPARLGALSFATVYRSAAEEARVGGDAYAAVTCPDGVRLLVADVRGKGIEAVGLAAEVLASFREHAPGPVGLTGLARHLEHVIAPQLTPEDFVTALLVEFTEDEVGLVSCGHPWPLLRHEGAVAEIAIPRPTRPLGLGVRPVLHRHPFRPGDQLIVFTDGLIETRDRAGRYFDPETALRGLPADLPLTAVLDALVTSLDRHAKGRLRDDLAIVIAEYVALAETSGTGKDMRVLSGEAGSPA
jgi:phosphoserine phosphatase RsbU/P